MSQTNTSDSLMITTAQWKDVFQQLNQWDALPKLREIHRGANSGMTATWLARLCSPNVAYLVVDTAGEIQLFHHFHHDVDDGLNDGTNQLWVLQGGSQHGPGCLHPTGPAEPPVEELRNRVDDYDRVEFY